MSRCALAGRAENLLAVEAAVLDENLRNLVSGDHAPCYVHTGYRSFERLTVDFRPPRRRVERDAESLEQLEIGTKADQGIHAIGGGHARRRPGPQGAARSRHPAGRVAPGSPRP